MSVVVLNVVGCAPEAPPLGSQFPVPGIEWNPATYIAFRATEITIDGVVETDEWAAAAWTGDFVDIEGDLQPKPRFRTRARMLWDDDFLYIGAEMEDPHVWGKLIERDAVIYQDNDFEVFIDPDGDSHEYYELEINALGTEWDLFLVKPYRDGGPALNAWDIQGLRTAVHVDGTLNDPTDIDAGWSVEIAIPWDVLRQAAHRLTPPADGDTWWLNFSRVQWKTEIVDGSYEKIIDADTGKNLREDNWVWSPQGLIAMHYPEMWGLVRFSHGISGARSFRPSGVDSVRMALYQVYYRQRQWKNATGHFSRRYDDLGLDPVGVSPSWPPRIEAGENFFSASVVLVSGDTMTIDHQGRIERQLATQH